MFDYEVGYKLFRLRKDGSLGSLFFNCSYRLPVGCWLAAIPIAKRGFAYRPGWHILKTPKCPHLSKKGRVIRKVLFCGNVQIHYRPKRQGGIWYTADAIYILSDVENKA